MLLLPAQANRFLGRESDLESIQSMLRREQTRLLTLTGAAGVGKTRLAIEAGSRMSGDFAQGITFIDLSLISDPSRVPQALARGVALQDVESPRLLERLFAYLRERRLLIILDNFEQVLPAAGWLADLSAVCPSITLLVTSREPLHLRWEQTYRVPPLALPDPDHLPPLPELAQVPAVALFLERAPRRAAVGDRARCGAHRRPLAADDPGPSRAAPLAAQMGSPGSPRASAHAATGHRLELRSARCARTGAF
jgi:hypothetical protein